MQKATILLLALWVAGLTGCSTLRDTSATPQTVRRLAAMDYPASSPHGPDLDLLLIRSGGQLRIVNRTATSYGGMQLWLNRQYVADIGSIQIGTDNLRDLTEDAKRYPANVIFGTPPQPLENLR